MSRTVFILGAGASKQAGAPVMKEFLRFASNIQKTQIDITSNELKCFTEVFEAIHILKEFKNKTKIDFNNIEEVFAAFEMGWLTGRLGEFPPKKLSRLRKSMKKVIVKTIEANVKFPVKQYITSAAPPYDDFVKLTRSIHRNEGGIRQISVITFNYDVALEHALYMEIEHTGVDYNLLNKPHITNRLKVFKLHGSINWVKCRGCGEIVAWDLFDYLLHHPIDSSSESERESSFELLGISKNLHQFTHCKGKRVETDPVIIPPTWNKTEYSQQLSGVWKGAVKELSEAENIFAIGYSLPPTDQFFKHFFFVANMEPTSIKRIWVFNPDKKVNRRFRNLLGPTLKERYRFFKNTFEEAIKVLKGEFKIVK